TRQCGRVLSDAKNDPITNCPAVIDLAARPTFSTMLQYSCPIGVGASVALTPRYGHRSDPQMQVADSLMTGSVGSTIVGAARSSKRTSRTIENGSLHDLIPHDNVRRLPIARSNGL